jgi:hypothetical protein
MSKNPRKPWIQTVVLYLNIQIVLMFTALAFVMLD